MNHTLRWINPQDIKFVSQFMREHDRIEWQLMSSSKTSSMETIIRDAVDRSSFSMAAVNNDTVIALFGVVPLSDTPAIGSIWALTTENVELPSVYRPWFKISKQLVHSIGKPFDRLENLVHEKNTKAIKFIHLIGFKILDEPKVIKGERFFPFYMDFIK
ncbi:hypothetical protein AB835_13790 [Candidatus Endobugula sertula]|uniref:N-acetyltransferase domain-containing protein n=1 Tax=Candidatus Endobugula sertula TaxID=62101 RepID=A0A1D2QLQ9_9GAMM|nr:hypothetical protein AB835_13790 [Candidatus Endobugula sertula]